MTLELGLQILRMPDQMFGSFMGRAGGGGTEGNKNSLVNLDLAISDNKDAAVDFTNQLPPQQPVSI